MTDTMPYLSKSATTEPRIITSARIRHYPSIRANSAYIQYYSSATTTHHLPTRHNELTSLSRQLVINYQTVIAMLIILRKRARRDIEIMRGADAMNIADKLRQYDTMYEL